MRLLKKYIFFLSTIFIFQSCLSPNDKIYSKFESDLKDSIKMINAEKFDYTDFALYPQKSYFLNSKLKLLFLKSSGEMCDSETYYLFDSKSDSILYILSRTKCYHSPERLKKETDTVYVTNFKNKTEEKYSNGEIAKKTTIKIANFYLNDIMFDIKSNTEKKYNSR